MARRRWKCRVCGTQEKLFRVDKAEGPDYKELRGLGAVGCPTEGCTEHAEAVEQASMSPGRHFYCHAMQFQRVSDRRWNYHHDHVMAEVLSLAVQANMEFFPWDGEFVPFNEGFYKLATKHDRGVEMNLSAAVAIENSMGRPAFRLHGERIFVGSELPEWGGLVNLSVTSFGHSDELGHYLIACAYRSLSRDDIGVCPTCGSYAREMGGRLRKAELGSGEQPMRLLKITKAELDAVSRERKAFVTAMQRGGELTVTKEVVKGWAKEHGASYWLKDELIDSWFGDKAELNEPDLLKAVDALDDCEHYHRRAVREWFRRHHKLDEGLSTERCVGEYERVIAHLRKEPAEWTLGGVSDALLEAVTAIAARCSPKTRIVRSKTQEEE